MYTARNKIIAMAPGTSLEFGFDEIALQSVRYYASVLGKTMGREYHTRTVKSRNVYVITREA